MEKRKLRGITPLIKTTFLQWFPVTCRRKSKVLPCLVPFSPLPSPPDPVLLLWLTVLQPHLPSLCCWKNSSAWVRIVHSVWNATCLSLPSPTGRVPISRRRNTSSGHSLMTSSVITSPTTPPLLTVDHVTHGAPFYLLHYPWPK